MSELQWGIPLLLSECFACCYTVAEASERCCRPWAVVPFQLVTRNGPSEICASLCLLVDFSSEFFSTRRKAYPPTLKCFRRMPWISKHPELTGRSSWVENGPLLPCEG
eukprot:IDg10185t1